MNNTKNVTEMSFFENSDTKTIDSTKIKSFLGCRRKFFFEHYVGINGTRSSHLTFGIAWHIAMEKLLTATVEEAQIAFSDYLTNEGYEYLDPSSLRGKTVENGLNAIKEYAEQYIDQDKHVKVKHVEIGGKIQIDDTHDLAYKIDAILERDNEIYVQEHKTGGMLVNWWGDQWKHSVQINTYAYVLMCLFAGSHKVEVNGAFLRTPLKNGKTNNAFIRVPIRLTVSLMEMWLSNILTIFLELDKERELFAKERTSLFKTTDNIMQSFPMNETNCFAYMQKCRFFNICSFFPNPVKYYLDNQLSEYEEIRIWNPLTEESRIKEIKNIKRD